MSVSVHASFGVYGAKVLSITGDPSVAPGLASPIGTLAVEVVTGVLYQKNGVPDTAWYPLSSKNIDGGSPDAVYVSGQVVNGGTP